MLAPCRAILGLAVIVASTSLAHAQDQPGADLKRNQPPLVAALIDRIINCNHWLGEPPYDDARAKEINATVAKLGCKDLAKDEASVLRRYPGNRSAQEAIRAAHRIVL